MKRFSSILIANRGEIAVRIIRTAKGLGYETIAVYSDADEAAMHVREADKAVRIGPAPAVDSYLSIDRIIKAAKTSGAEAIHPGYGFLSENADFAEACAKADIVFIGPTPHAIRTMGDKAKARALMQEIGVPVVPGWQGDDQSVETLKSEAGKIGYPLLIKAAAGGGGRGMREVRSAKDFETALESARREAKAAFGDDTVLLEKLIEGGRHIEIQIIADEHGNTLHLGERDCSVQRRRQKVIEEAPAPHLDPDIRDKMAEDAIKAAESVDYVGAGTVEYLLSADGSYYFLEMNTRLQVEHPVTDLVHRVRLIEEQISVADGENLAELFPYNEPDRDLDMTGIELRLYAEDPARAFAPDSGAIHYFPDWVAGVEARIDRGYVTHDVVRTHYDPLIAKFINCDDERYVVIDELIDALKTIPLLGVRTNRDFLIAILKTDEFREGRFTVDLLDQWQSEGSGPFDLGPLPFEHWAIAALFLAAPSTTLRSPSVTHFDLALEGEGETKTLSVKQRGPGKIQVTDGDDFLDVALISSDGEQHRILIDSVQQTLHAARLDDGRWHIALGDRVAMIGEVQPGASTQAEDDSILTAPVTGQIVSFTAKAGATVKAGETLAVIEAMKMEVPVTAARDGVIKTVHASEGQSASAGAVLIELETNDG